ncbi:hypothetical protein EHJ00_08385 [Cronobacter sakazakii]|nr:hypothetical protein [Cronobacter sakazakii]PUV45215.1 hypothetical protein CDU02_03760 [Cronobacter sakazakii]TWR38429.1 hypothetical protein FQY86_12160 [Cronobacter sakazakii]
MCFLVIGPVCDRRDRNKAVRRLRPPLTTRYRCHKMPGNRQPGTYRVMTSATHRALKERPQKEIKQRNSVSFFGMTSILNVAKRVFNYK